MPRIHSNDAENEIISGSDPAAALIPHTTRGYQQEMFIQSLERNIIIVLDTGSGKTHIAVLRLRHELEKDSPKLCWFLTPTVFLAEQQHCVITLAVPVPVGCISGGNEPNQWKSELWRDVLQSYRVMVSTPQVLLDALRHGFIVLGRDISLIIFDEAHHAVDNHPYNMIMKEFYFDLPSEPTTTAASLTMARPAILGLTASPIFGGDVDKAFRTIEANLDSAICTPIYTREELAQYVHRPKFKCIAFRPEQSHSTNLSVVQYIVAGLDINDDPLVKSLKQRLATTAPNAPSWRQIDQSLSKALYQKTSFTQKGLADFIRAAQEIVEELGGWAADWYVYEVVQKGLEAAKTNQMRSWKAGEKKYLEVVLGKIAILPPVYSAEEICGDMSHKAKVLIDCLLDHKFAADIENEPYSCLIFVKRRDVVLALYELLTNHPDTKDTFSFGFLLGTSQSTKRHSFLDITTRLKKASQDVTLREFKSGLKNVIIATSVAEEGIDVQACGSVIRWDLPPNVVSWAQSRGRARKQKSTFTLLVAQGEQSMADVKKWEQVERDVVQRMTGTVGYMGDEVVMEDVFEDDPLELRNETTGALLNLDSAVPHLAHFCAVMPNQGSLNHRPIYETDPPEFKVGWHGLVNPPAPELRLGPFGASVTLPRLLPEELRRFSTPRSHRTMHSAYRHAAFNAYKTLYEADLLDENLLPFTDRGGEIAEIMKEVEQKKGLVDISSGVQVNPWKNNADGERGWYFSKLTIDGLPPLHLFTRCRTPCWDSESGPKLHVPGLGQIGVLLEYRGVVEDEVDEDSAIIRAAKFYTRQTFWPIFGVRMEWGNLDFSYLLLPVNFYDEDEERTVWAHRQAILETMAPERHVADYYNGNAATLGNQLGYPDDLFLVRDNSRFAKPFRFARWRYDPLSAEEEEAVRFHYSRRVETELVITYPVLVVRALPARTNLLLPIPASAPSSIPQKEIILLQEYSLITMISRTQSTYATLLPSTMRALAKDITIDAMQRDLFASQPTLGKIPRPLLMTAMTAPVAQEPGNYQRLETLGDTVLKYIISVQLLAEYPLWHEGYLSRRKDHAVANARLANENLTRGMHRWIIQDFMLGRKWKPAYERLITPPALVPAPDSTAADVNSTQAKGKKKKKKGASGDKMSTKMLADVVESVIGAAYLHGGYELAYECIKFFGLGIDWWQPTSIRVEQMLGRVRTPEQEMPIQIQYVESMLGYTFQRKLLIIEALTHSSYQGNLGTISYERMEFLGDAVLDMIVTDYLYHSPQKYSPGHMFLRKSAMVNAHLLAYICLRTSLDVDALMPLPDGEGNIEVTDNTQTIHLWQCLLFSEHEVLDQQRNCFTRFSEYREEIETGLNAGTIFPWASLIRCQSPKFMSDMVESLLGAVFLDTQGDLEIVRQVLRSLGIYQILERIVAANVDVLHPVSRLDMFVTKKQKKVTYKIWKEEGNVICDVYIDDECLEAARTKEVYTGRISQDGVRFASAEAAVRALGLVKGANHGRLSIAQQEPKTVQKEVIDLTGSPEVIDLTHLE